MKKYKLVITNAFKKDYKKIKKRQYNLNLLNAVVSELLEGKELDPKYKDHNLSGDWQGYRECHIQPDWLLIYEIMEDKLILSLTGTGTHSDLFGK